MLYTSQVKKALEYSAISIVCCAFCASGCAYSENKWRVYFPEIQQDSKTASNERNNLLVDDSSRLIQLIREEPLIEERN